MSACTKSLLIYVTGWQDLWSVGQQRREGRKWRMIWKMSKEDSVVEILFLPEVLKITFHSCNDSIRWTEGKKMNIPTTPLTSRYYIYLGYPPLGVYICVMYSRDTPYVPPTHLVVAVLRSCSGLAAALCFCLHIPGECFVRLLLPASACFATKCGDQPLLLFPVAQPTQGSRV